jgi:hypothetical protein
MRRAIPGTISGLPTDVERRERDGRERQWRDRSRSRPTTTASFSSRVGRRLRARAARPTSSRTRSTTSPATFAEHDSDEFYWDTNGTGWYQPFGERLARACTCPTSSPAQLTGQAACYYGYEGSSTTCELTRTRRGGRVVSSRCRPDLAVPERHRRDRLRAAHLRAARTTAYFGSISGWLQLAERCSWRSPLISGHHRCAELRSPTAAVARRSSRSTRRAEGSSTSSAILIGTSRARRAVASARRLGRHPGGSHRRDPNTGMVRARLDYMLELVDATAARRGRAPARPALFGYQLAPGTGYLMSKTRPVPERSTCRRSRLGDDGGHARRLPPARSRSCTHPARSLLVLVGAGVRRSPPGDHDGQTRSAGSCPCCCRAARSADLCSSSSRSSPASR